VKPLVRILAATDLSAPARHAVARAFSVAAATGAQLTLLHVLDQMGLERLRALPGGSAQAVEQRLLDEARQRLGQMVAELGPRHSVGAGVRLVSGRVLAAILDEADALDAQLVVLGARGEGHLGRMLLGTTAERLLRRSIRPMLVVKQFPHEAYRRVLVPVDFSPWSRLAVELARAVAPTAELILLTAFEAPFEAKLRYAGVEEEVLNRYLAAARQEALQRLQALADGFGLRPGESRLLARHGEAARVILHEELEQDCDLVCLGKHGQGMLEELLLGSVTKHVLAESVGDVLVAVVPDMA